MFKNNKTILFHLILTFHVSKNNNSSYYTINKFEKGFL